MSTQLKASHYIMCSQIGRAVDFINCQNKYTGNITGRWDCASKPAIDRLSSLLQIDYLDKVEGLCYGAKCGGVAQC